MGCLYVLALEVGSLVGLSACGACPGGWSPAQRAPFQGRVGRHGGESVAAGSDSRVPLGAGAPPTRRLRGPTRRVARSLPLGASRLPTGTPSGRRHVPVGGRVGLSNCDSKSEWEHGGAARTGQGGASARRGDLAGSHSPARVGGAPLPCARHFLWGTFLTSDERVLAYEGVAWCDRCDVASR